MNAVPSDTDFFQLLIAGGAAMLAAIVLLFAVLSIGLVVVFWGKWKPLISSLGSMAAVLGVATVAVILLVEAGLLSGIPDWIEATVFLSAVLATMLAAACVLIGLFALIHHKRWGVLIGLGAVPLIGFLAAFVSYPTFEEATREQNVTTMVSIPTDRGNSVDLTEWVDQVNGEPDITIDDPVGVSPATPVLATPKPADAVPSPRSEIDGKEATTVSADDRPVWVDGDLAANQTVFIAGPFTSKRSCRDDTAGQVATWMREQFNDAYPELATSGVPFEVDLDRVVKAEHTERRETSVGEMHLLYTLVEVDDLQRQAFANAAKNIRRQGGLRAVAIGGGLLIGLVGVLHGVLRSGGRQPENTIAGQPEASDHG